MNKRPVNIEITDSNYNVIQPETIQFIDTNNIRVTFATSTSGYATVTFGQVNLSAIPENIIPDTDNSRALGSASKRWSTLHSQTLNTGDIIMKNDNGHFTLDEQNGYIRVFNHSNNKFYRILMEEI